jgi:hypothetical protein
MSFEHSCDAPELCRFRGPADCSCRGLVGHLMASAVLPKSVLRRFQRQLDAAKTDAEVGRIIVSAELDAHLRRLENEARQERIAHLKRDPAGYRREFRMFQNQLRELCRQARLEREAERRAA